MLQTSFTIKVICVQLTKSVGFIKEISTALLEYIDLFIKVVYFLYLFGRERFLDIGGLDNTGLTVCEHV